MPATARLARRALVLSLPFWFPAYLSAEVAEPQGAGSPAELTFLTAIVDSRIWLEGPTRVEVSPDGLTVYATARSDECGCLMVLSRDAGSGLLSRTQSRFEAGVRRARTVRPSADGLNVYATGMGFGMRGRLVVYARNPGDGHVSHLETLRDGFEIPDFTLEPWAIVLSPAEDHLYVTSDRSLHALERDPLDGRLTHLQRVERPPGQRGLAVTADGNHAYVAGGPELAAYSLGPGSGLLTEIAVYQDGVGGVDGLDGASSVLVSPDDRFVYVASEVDDAVAIFSRDRTTGLLAFEGAIFDGQGQVQRLDGAVDLATDPEGDQLYVAALVDSAVSVFDRSPLDGGLSLVEEHVDGLDGVDGLFLTSSVTVSPDGTSVYATGREDHRVVTFARDLSGKLTFVPDQFEPQGPTGLDRPRAIASNPGDEHLYVVAGGTALGSSLTVLRREPADGSLEVIDVHDDVLTGPVDVAASLDGAHVYVLSPLSQQRITIFSANPDGTLSLDEEQQFAELDDVRELVFSPDGTHLYAIGGGLDHDLVTFERDPVSGLLDLLEFSAGFRLNALTFRPDGLRAYGSVDNSLLVLDRDPDSGHLSVLTDLEVPDAEGSALDPTATYLYVNAKSTIDPIARVVLPFLLGTGGIPQPLPEGPPLPFRAVEIVIPPTPDHRIYANSWDEDTLLNAVASLRRDPESGAVELGQVVALDDQGGHGFVLSSDLLVTRDGRHLYVLGTREDAVAIFATHVLFTDGFESGTTAAWTETVGD